MRWLIRTPNLICAVSCRCIGSAFIISAVVELDQLSLNCISCRCIVLAVIISGGFCPMVSEHAAIPPVGLRSSAAADQECWLWLIFSENYDQHLSDFEFPSVFFVSVIFRSGMKPGNDSFMYDLLFLILWTGLGRDYGFQAAWRDFLQGCPFSHPSHL